MANPEHLKILKQGVKAWNKWREEESDVNPDLSSLNLSEVKLVIDWAASLGSLKGVNFSKTNLKGANLNGTDLRLADMKKANLVPFLKRNFHFCHSALDAESRPLASWIPAPSGTSFRRNDTFVKSDTYLMETALGMSQLIETNLAYADLTEACLDGAAIIRAEIYNGNLSYCYGVEGLFRQTNFHYAKLIKANLRNADLRLCNFVKADLTGATLTGAKMYGTTKDDWVIKDINCEFVYWDEEGKITSPKDRWLKLGEFERLYAALPTIEYIFEQGMSPLDPLIMERIVLAIRERRPEFDIKVDSINARGLAPSIKFTVQQEEHKEPALQEVQKGYHERIKRLEAEKDRLYDLLGQAIDKDSVKLIAAGPGANVATDGSTINIEQHIHNALDLQKAIADEPEESESFTKVAKKTALNIIGGAIKDIAKGQVKEAAKQIVELGKDLGPIIAQTAAYAFFRSMC